MAAGHGCGAWLLAVLVRPSGYLMIAQRLLDRLAARGAGAARHLLAQRLLDRLAVRSIGSRAVSFAAARRVVHGLSVQGGALDELRSGLAIGSRANTQIRSAVNASAQNLPLATL